MASVRARRVLLSLGRMARTAELRACGVTEAELTRAVRSGEVVKPRQGVYALSDTPEQAIHAAAHGGTIGCCAAAALYGLWILRVPDETHVWMGRGGTPRLDGDGCRIHWDEGRVQVGALPPVANVLLQVACCADDETFFAALESALRQSLLGPGDLAWLWHRLPSDMRWLVGFARGDADSGLESLIRLRLHRLGIEVCTQVTIDGVGEVDFVIDGRLIIEADGKGNHGNVENRVKDLRRDAAASALGYETLRFTYSMIVHEWPSVIAAIRGAMLRLSMD